MKNGMKETHRVRKFEPEGVFGDLFEDFKGSQSLVIELLRRSSSLDVLRIQPNQGSRHKGIRDGKSESISWAFILGLSNRDLFSAITVKFAELSREIMGIRIGY